MFDRREFLKTSVKFAGATGVAGLGIGVARSYAGSSEKMGVLIGTQKDFRIPEGEDNHKLFQYFWAHDLDSGKKKVVSISFSGHGFAISDSPKGRIYIVEKWGKHLAQFDLKKWGNIKVKESSPNREYYGHAACANDRLYVTEVIKDEGYLAGKYGSAKGMISVRNPSTLEVINEFSSHGTAPHDCRLVKKQSVLLVANTGKSNRGVHGKSSLVLLDVKSGQLLEKLQPNNENVNISHFDVSKKLEIFAGSVGSGKDGKGTGHLCFYSPEKGLNVWEYEPEVKKKMVNEILSVAMDHEANIGCATSPHADLVSFWSLKEQKFMKAVTVSRPQGVSVTLDGKYFVVTSYQTNSKSLHFFKTADLSEVAVLPYSKKIDGSHTAIVNSFS